MQYIHFFTRDIHSFNFNDDCFWVSGTMLPKHMIVTERPNFEHDNKYYHCQDWVVSDEPANVMNVNNIRTVMGRVIKFMQDSGMNVIYKVTITANRVFVTAATVPTVDASKIATAEQEVAALKTSVNLMRDVVDAAVEYMRYIDAGALETYGGRDRRDRMRAAINCYQQPWLRDQR